MTSDPKWSIYEGGKRTYSIPPTRHVEITVRADGGYRVEFFEPYARSGETGHAFTFWGAKRLAQKMFKRKEKFRAKIAKEWSKTMPKTPDEAPIGHPEPPHETAAGADSTPAPNLAEMAGDQLEAEQLATDE